MRGSHWLINFLCVEDSVSWYVQSPLQDPQRHTLIDQEHILSCMWWHAPVIISVGWVGQEDCEFDARLSYVEVFENKQTAQNYIKHLSRCLVYSQRSILISKIKVSGTIVN